MAEKINIGAKEPLYKAAEKINGAMDEVNTFQKQIDEIVVEGDSSVEAAQARVTEDGQTFDTLRDRLNSSDRNLAQTMNLNNQGASFVEKLLGYVNIKSMYVTRNTSGDGGINIGVILDDELKTVVEYVFRHRDGLLLLRGVKTGYQKENEKPSISLNGDFDDYSAPDTFTTTEGDSFTFEFTGTKFIFKRRVETRGGLWEFQLSNGMTRKMTCYNDSTISGKEDVVFDDLPHATYKVKATFLGDDPVNPSSDTPRGYIHYDGDDLNSNPIIIDSLNVIDDNTSRYLVSPDSIPDFAISAKPNGATYNHVWVPMHGTTSGVSPSSYIKVIIDGIPRIQSRGGLLSQDFFDVNNIEIIQTFDAVNPNGSDGTMWKHYVSHVISKDKPYCEITNRIEVQQDIDVVAMYFNMLSAVSNQVSRLVLNNGTEYNSIPTDGSDFYLGTDISSAMFSGMYKSGETHATAIDTLSFTEAIDLRRREGNLQPTRITFRADNVAKFYLETMKGLAKQGEVYSNTQRILCVTGIRYPNNLVKTI